MLCVYLGTLTSKLCPVDVKISLCLTGLPRVGSRPGEFFSGPLPPRASDITSMTPSTHRGWVSRIQAWLGGTCSTGMALLLVASNSRVLLGQGVRGALGATPQSPASSLSPPQEEKHWGYLFAYPSGHSQWWPSKLPRGRRREQMSERAEQPDRNSQRDDAELGAWGFRRCQADRAQASRESTAVGHTLSSPGPLPDHQAPVLFPSSSPLGSLGSCSLHVSQPAKMQWLAATGILSSAIAMTMCAWLCCIAVLYTSFSLCVRLQGCIRSAMPASGWY